MLLRLLLIRLSFFKAPDYDEKVAQFAEENKQPYSPVELLASSVTRLPETYKGSAMVSHEVLRTTSRHITDQNPDHCWEI